MCCVSDCKKIENSQERSLRYVLNDFNNTYSNLLHTASKSTECLARLRILAIEILEMVKISGQSLYKQLFMAQHLQNVVPI